MEKIFIIDDTKNIRILLSTCLEAEGYQIRTASDGKQAFQLLQAETFDLILLDIKLPEISGTELLRRLRGLGVATPVLIMTAFATVKNAIECTKLGAVAYLQKPFTAGKIRQAVAEVLSLKGSGNFPWEVQIREFIARAEFARADTLLKKALADNPLSGQVYHLLGQLSEAQGNPGTATKYYSLAKQLQQFDD